MVDVSQQTPIESENTPVESENTPVDNTISETAQDRADNIRNILNDS